MQNLLDPAILFFVFGLLAGVLRSDLEIPPQVAKFLSLYLLMALGLKGGFALAQSGMNLSVIAGLGAAMTMAAVVPALGYAVLKRHVSPFDAAAVAASYGSVSAVTFVTAMQYLETNQLAVSGHMTVAMVAMESPAILMAIVLATSLRHAHATNAGMTCVTKGASAGTAAGTAAGAASGGAASAVAAPIGMPGGALIAMLGAGAPRADHSPGPWQILRESFTNGANLLLLGAMVIGLITGEAGHAVMQPFTGELFKGMLAFFLLDMGLTVARNLGSVRGRSPVLIAYALLAPLAHASIALGLAAMIGMSAGDAALLMVLSASASYIVVPAVLRHAIPEANPSLYLGLSLGVTFPLNILAGIPLYTYAAQRILG